ncbi:MAG: hypothetical protein WDM76_02635 [Limisphaerales bacterium]
MAKRHFQNFDEWNNPDYLQVLPDSVELNASAGRQIEGVSRRQPLCLCACESFGESNNPEVPTYPVELTPAGFRADYISTVSNYPTKLKHLNPPRFPMAAVV